jgi:preprotein translocase YajC subunit
MIWVLALAYPAAIAVLFYFAFLRPVNQHQRRQRDELASLRVGDEVLTQAGFIAVIKEVRGAGPDRADTRPRWRRSARRSLRHRPAPDTAAGSAS